MAAAPQPAAAATESPLLAAFKHLFSALNPAASASTATSQSPTEKLAAFLHQMAQSLAPRSNDTAHTMPTSGSLINVTA